MPEVLADVLPTGEPRALLAQSAGRLPTNHPCRKPLKAQAPVRDIDLVRRRGQELWASEPTEEYLNCQCADEMIRGAYLAQWGMCPSWPDGPFHLGRFFSHTSCRLSQERPCLAGSVGRTSANTSGTFERARNVTLTFEQYTALTFICTVPVRGTIEIGPSSRGLEVA